MREFGSLCERMFILRAIGAGNFLIPLAGRHNNSVCLGRTVAVVTDSYTSLLHGRSFNMFRRFKYELAFESPTHGIFYTFANEAGKSPPAP